MPVSPQCLFGARHTEPRDRLPLGTSNLAGPKSTPWYPAPTGPSSFILSGCSSASLAPCALPWMAPYRPKKITQPLAKHLTWLPQTFLASFPFLLPCMVLPDSGGRWLVNMPGDATGSHTPKSERRVLTMRLRQRPPPTPRHRHPCSSLCPSTDCPPVLKLIKTQASP